MDGVHDLGGRQGFGRVRYTLDAPAFHASWEVRVNALYGHAVRRGIFKNQLVRGPVGFTLDDHARAEVDRLFDRLQAVL